MSTFFYGVSQLHVIIFMYLRIVKQELSDCLFYALPSTYNLMYNKLSPDQRHRNMAAIRAKNTKPEIIVRKYLWSHGFRYRLNHPRLPGKPDIVLRKYHTCIFVNGCFWHGHNVRYENENEMQRYENVNENSLESSECCKIPHTNRDFWVKKIMRNKERDIEVQKKLAAMGWHSITIWECELKSSVREQTLTSLAFTLNHIFLELNKTKRYELPEDTDYVMAAEDTTEYEKKCLRRT